MSHDPLTKAEIRARIAAALRECLEFYTMQAAFADGPEAERHTATVDILQKMLARGAAMRASETRH
jgi:hypothetical protein